MSITLMSTIGQVCVPANDSANVSLNSELRRQSEGNLRTYKVPIAT